MVSGRYLLQDELRDRRRRTVALACRKF